MPVETADYINQLVPANPLDTDQEGQGAAQMRLIKAAVLASFPNVNAPVTSTPAQLNSAGTAFAAPSALTIVADPGVASSGLGGTIYLQGGTAGAPNAAIQTVNGALNLYTLNPAGTTLAVAVQLPQSGGMALLTGGLNITSGGGVTLTGPGGVVEAGTGTAGVYAGTTPLSFVGEVRMFWGQPSQIPAGWHLCDGTAGTPDLRDRFLVGAGLSYALGTAGGVATYSLNQSQLPSHSHGLNDPGHGHFISDPGHVHGINDPGHSHTFLAPTGANGGDGNFSSFSGPGQAAFNTNASLTGIGVDLAGTGIGVVPGGTGLTVQATGSGAAIENRPPFVGICFIMRIA